MANRKPLIIYFDDQGNMLEQAGYYKNPKTEEAKDFEDQLEFVSFSRSTSGSFFTDYSIFSYALVLS